ncbi:hypothetical protein AKJ16_DCAP18915 [Drosera capensis]
MKKLKSSCSIRMIRSSNNKNVQLQKSIEEKTMASALTITVERTVNEGPNRRCRLPNKLSGRKIVRNDKYPCNQGRTQGHPRNSYVVEAIICGKVCHKISSSYK